jgi:hypothetical protein
VNRPALLRGMARFAIEPRSVAINATGFLLGCAQYTAVAFIIVGLLHEGAPRAVAGLSLWALGSVGPGAANAFVVTASASGSVSRRSASPGS